MLQVIVVEQFFNCVDLSNALGMHKLARLFHTLTLLYNSCFNPAPSAAPKGDLVMFYFILHR
jgi:hypothetical protein